MERKEYIRGLEFWDTLNDEERDFFERSSSIRVCEKDEMIFGLGGSCPGMIYVIDGSIRVFILSEEGREVTLFRVEEGESCILSASCVLSQISFETHMVATEKTRILTVGAGAYEKLMNSNLALRCFTYELAAERFSSVVCVMEQILFARFDRRLAGFLIREFEKSGNPEIRMTQEEMAREVSSAREVVARMLKQFSSDGLIESRRGSVILRDIEALRELAG